MNASLKALLNEQYKLVANLREENKKLNEKVRFLEECLDNKEKVNKSLREENKKLKEYNGELIENHKKDIAILCEENKNLNIKVASLEGEIKGLNSTIDKLKEENQTLELWLDRKEKLNEKYRKEIDTYVYDAKQVRDIC